MIAVAPPVLEVPAVLREVFGHGALRTGQREAVDAVLAGRDAVVLLPTGGGKSLCYQLPAVVANRAGRGTTIVVSPLIALMEDQVGALCGRGVAAAAIHSHQDDDERHAVIGRLVRGELTLLYISPERAALDGFQRLLARQRVALIAIDEAHCLSQWGHDFRPEYLRLHELRRVIDAPVIALTATATPRVMDEIAGELRMRDPLIVRGDFARPNLSFSVHHLGGDAARIDAVIAACDAAGLRARSGAGRAIVYCGTRKKAEAVAEALASAGFPAGHYHAGRTPLARERAQRAFSLGRTRILVATNAFGMGIDHGDVRLIVHFQTPGSLEAYYQEAGRAGRDGEPARCVMLFGPADLMMQRRLQQGGSGGAATEHRTELALAAIERYARSARCRQQLLCAHFTGADDHRTCGTCDACVDPAAVAAAASEAGARGRAEADAPPLPDGAAELIVTAVGRLARPIGRGDLARMLRGSRAKGMSRYARLPEYGALAEASEASIIAAVDRLIGARKLERRGRRYPTVWIAGRPVRSRAADAPPGAAPKRRSSRSNPIARELDNYRRRRARELKWKAYMVFQRRVIAAIDQQRPTTLDALARIPGLGPAKIARFGDDILSLVRRHAPADARD